MADYEYFYDINPVGVVDQNHWTLKDAQVNLQFESQAVYTPLIDWDSSPMATGAETIETFELMEGEVDSNPIPMTANYIAEAQAVDSRSRKWSVLRYGDKVQLHESSNIFNQWKFSNSNDPSARDWKPLLRGLLGWNVVEKHEILSRNVWFKGSKSYWTYAGDATNWGELADGDRFSINRVKNWKLSLGSTGSPIVPGDKAHAKLALIPPGATYDWVAGLPGSSDPEVAMYRYTEEYGGVKLNWEIGQYLGVRFQEVPNNKYGLNKNVLYNCGAITKQHGVINPINSGDGSPDPETTAVDEVWYIGQKDVTHWIQLEDFAQGDYKVNQFVTIHMKRTNTYGVTGGVDPFDGRTIVRRVVDVDYTLNRLAFDRPVLFNYTAGFVGSAVSGVANTTIYAYVTKGLNVGFSLVLGSRGGVQGKVMRPLRFKEPKPIDKQNCRLTEQFVSEKSEDCWNTLKPTSHNVAGNGKRDGVKMVGMFSLN